MRFERLIGLVKLSLAHHPICYLYRNHTLQIKNFTLCLGCTGFYSGCFVGIFILIFGKISTFGWWTMVIVAAIMAIPTIFRLMNVPIFSSQDKRLRFVFRWLLGIGVVIGFMSIFIAPNLYIGVIQFFLGLATYIGISLKRVLSDDLWNECQDCSFIRAPDCPGFAPFLFHPKPKEQITL
ncbi:MAG: DUF2085 domain-containing protein [Candidatus Hodarchaeales archaeon]|jgi:uncharacterized membrane protein